MSNNRRYNFLLADDDREDQEILIEAILQLKPDTIINTVFNGQQVLDQLDSTTPEEWPNLIILDFKMPKLNATEVLERIVQVDVPKVVWSTSTQPEHINRCMELGALHYFVKPNSRLELNEMVQELFHICCG
jgi:CheY-like chemotaxis protein